VDNKSQIFYPSRLTVFARWTLCFAVIVVAVFAISFGVHRYFWLCTVIVILSYGSSIFGLSLTIDTVRGVTYETFLYSLRIEPQQLSQINFDGPIVSISNPDSRRGINFAGGVYRPKVGRIGVWAVGLRKMIVGNRLSFYAHIWGIGGTAQHHCTDTRHHEQRLPASDSSPAGTLQKQTI